jgi:hypothetical protein
MRNCHKSYLVAREAVFELSIPVPRTPNEIRSEFHIQNYPATQELNQYFSYMLATDLHTQLDDLSGSLTQMIEAVNGLSVSNKPNGESNDDPMTQISQILSSHLESLQWIDGAVRDVDSKVTDIEKRVKDSGYGLTGGNKEGKSRGFGLNR